MNSNKKQKETKAQQGTKNETKGGGKDPTNERDNPPTKKQRPQGKRQHVHTQMLFFGPILDRHWLVAQYLCAQIWHARRFGMLDPRDVASRFVSDATQPSFMPPSLHRTFCSNPQISAVFSPIFCLSVSQQHQRTQDSSKRSAISPAMDSSL
jgi:hypothetical protein